MEWYWPSVIFLRYADRNEPTDDRENLFEEIIETLSELKPGNQDLIDFITKPLVLEFYVNVVFSSAMDG